LNRSADGINFKTVSSVPMMTMCGAGDILFAISGQGTPVASTDQGHTWNPIQIPANFTAYDLSCYFIAQIGAIIITEIDARSILVSNTKTVFS
jgi:photosystem II stability/assembly factor-like uncharacterized protein